MSVLTIRANKRYATRLPVEVRRDNRKTAEGLMIELSQEGARISNLGRCKYAAGDQVVIATVADVELEGTIRWAHDGIAGIRLNRPLHQPEMRDLLEINRQQQPATGLQYGT